MKNLFLIFLVIYIFPNIICGKDKNYMLKKGLSWIDVENNKEIFYTNKIKDALLLYAKHENQYKILITLLEKDKKLFYEISKKYTKKKISLFIDDKLMLSAIFYKPIENGEFKIYFNKNYKTQFNELLKLQKYANIKHNYSNNDFKKIVQKVNAKKVKTFKSDNDFLNSSNDESKIYIKKLLASKLIPALKLNDDSSITISSQLGRGYIEHFKVEGVIEFFQNKKSFTRSKDFILLNVEKIEDKVFLPNNKSLKTIPLLFYIKEDKNTLIKLLESQQKIKVKLRGFETFTLVDPQIFFAEKSRNDKLKNGTFNWNMGIFA